MLFGIATTGQWELDIVAAHSYRFQRMLWACDLPFDIRTPQLVGMTAWTQNAYYMPSLNSINMLPGLMLFPLFDASNPMMLNLAQMGFVATEHTATCDASSPTDLTHTPCARSPCRFLLLAALCGVQLGHWT